MTANIKILAVDDNPVNIKVVSQFLATQNYEVIVAESGEEAIEKFKSDSPDIILMDVMMPGINGLEATARIKALAGNKWVPVIFMSALSSDEDKIKGLDIGGDDYITKPVEFNILAAKLKAVQRISDIQNKLSDAMEELQSYRQAEELEQEMAYELMNRLFTAEKLEGKDIHVWHIPATLFSGDLITGEKIGERLYILHADSTGHGLTAALPLLPVAQSFYDMAKRGFSIGRMAQRMNKQLKEFMPINRFVAMTLTMIDRKNNIVEVWNGGNPPVYVLGSECTITQQIASSHMALGILDDDSFDERTEFAKCTDDSVVVMFSDGLIEAEDKQDNEFGYDKLIEAFGSNNSAPVLRNAIVEAVCEHLGDKKAHDDMSLIVASTQG